jgi:ATP-dependent DNA helicase RecQ
VSTPPEERDDVRQNAALALHAALGDVEFRPGQLEAIELVVSEGRRLLVVQRTGWGKSIVYLIATRLLRDAGAGVTIIVSPLLALMRDQLAAAESMGVRAVTINSSNIGDWDEIEQELLDDRTDLLLISPERLNNVGFRERLLIPVMSRAGLFVIDEAHCISDWGHDFRPDYRRITRILSLLPDGVPVLCTTATANDRVVSDISAQLGDVLVLRGPLDRESLSLHVKRLDHQAERLAWLAEWIPSVSGTGIVYCLTVADTHKVAEWLRSQGIDAVSYSGDADPAERLEIERRLKANEVKIVVATSALGMGFDKPDLAFVVHFQSPDSPVAYYQQVGRAGRGIDRAHAVLLAGSEDEEIWEWFLRTGLPVEAQSQEVVDVLAAAEGWMTLQELEARLNVSEGRLQSVLKVLDVDGAVEVDRRNYRRTPRPWSFDAERIEGVRRAREAEHQAMRDYTDLTECRMQFLRAALDDDAPERCGRCDNCTEALTPLRPSPALVSGAVAFLRHRPAVIDPRKRWVPPSSGNIPTDHRLREGRALALLADPGFGREVLDAKRRGVPFTAEMVAASAELIREWLPGFAGTVVPVPASDPARALVPEFAGRLADELGLAFAEPVRKIRATRPQKLMENSAQQLANLLGAYEVSPGGAAGPILLVDDVSDSRWTMTVIADLLAHAGVREIYPFAIARAKG